MQDTFRFLLIILPFTAFVNTHHPLSSAVHRVRLWGARHTSKVAYHTNVTTEVYSWGDARLPQLLREIPERDRPQKFYIKGSLPPSDALIVAVVGSRHPTSDALRASEHLGSALARAGVVVASGLALGCDAASHKGALAAGGHVIAVLGSGCDDASLSPKTNLELAHRVQNQGCLLSEYPDGTPPAPWQFPARNRFIAGISRAVIVVEAGEKSGSLITARLALDYGRDVYALPSSVWSNHGSGTNMLIHMGATIVPSIAQLLIDLGLTPEPSRASQHPHASLLALLSSPRSLDELLNIITIPRVDLLTLLTMLEIEGAVRAEHGKYIATL